MNVVSNRLSLAAFLTGCLLAAAEAAEAQPRIANIDQNGTRLQAGLTVAGSDGSEVEIRQSGEENATTVNLEQASEPVVIRSNQTGSRRSIVNARVSNATIGGSYVFNQREGESQVIELISDNAQNGAIDATQENDNQRLEVTFDNVSNFFLTPTQKGGTNNEMIFTATSAGDSSIFATQDGNSNLLTAEITGTGVAGTFSQVGDENVISYSSR